MKAALAELISKISSGCMGEDEILKVADEAAQAYACLLYTSPSPRDS